MADAEGKVVDSKIETEISSYILKTFQKEKDSDTVVLVYG